MSAPASEPEDTYALFDFSAKLKMAPEEPGVYIMRDRKGVIVYIGKSVNLRSRLRAYANQSDTRSFVQRLPLILGEIETIITATEKDALELECSLITTHRPRFNVAIPGEASYASFRLDVGHEAPFVELVRGEVPKDGARYFGPYRSTFAVRRLKEVLDRHFMLRTCTDTVMRGRKRPCLQYQIKRCSAPCVFDAESIGYGDQVEDAIAFLEGRREELRLRLLDKMLGSAEVLEYEMAAHYRDQIAAIDISEVRDASPNRVDIDVFGHYREGDALTIQVLFVRRGRLKDSRHFVFEEQSPFDEEVYSTFLNLYYNTGAYIPHEVLVPIDLDDAPLLAEVLSGLRNSRVQIKHPQRGRKAALIDTAMRNAEHSFREEVSGNAHVTAMLTKLQTRLKLENYPTRMECFDISNLQGAPMVGSMVVFEEGEPSKKAYRRYTIKNVKEQDDYACMYEVLTRRFKRGLSGEWPMPDLVVVDGGKGQLNQALEVMKELGVTGVDVMALAKSRVSRGKDAEVVERSLERVFLPRRKNALILKQNSPELFLLQRIRDEAHRFAIEYHRKLRRKKTLRSRLSEIDGVGIKRQKALLRHFGSLKRIKQASVEELVEVKGISKGVAGVIYAFFEGER